MKLAESLTRVAEDLAHAGLDDPRLESEFLVASVLGLTRTQLVLGRHMELEAHQLTRIAETSRRRQDREPLAYAVGFQPFGDLLLRVNAAVLVPRPETEHLVELIKESLQDAPAGLRIADIGTGSGNIALSLAAHPKVAAVYAVDLSGEALAIACENGNRYDLEQRCHWLQGDLVSPIAGQPPLDLIVANLPYIRRSELSALQPEVLHEPVMALDGGPEGHELIFRLLEQAPSVLQAKGDLWLEVGFDQAQKVRAYAEGSGAWSAVVIRDLAGIERFLRLRRKES